MTDRLVIIGAGQAGFALSAKLRMLGDMRPITMIGAEPEIPYQRPPLSKKYLLGEMTFERLTFRPAEWFVENKVELKLSTWVDAIDPAAQTVTCRGGEEIAYGTLAFATGSTPRRLPAAIGGDLKGVFVVRDKADADCLAVEMKPGRTLLVVGGGYIGLEAAAVARNLGLDVTVIEMGERILQRVASRETADAMRAIHESHGVTIREKTGLVRLIGENGHVTGAELADGTTMAVDLVIAGIGASANDALATAAGLATSNGIVVDEYARSSDPNIYAMGDCAVLPWKGAQVRLESVQNAIDQAEAVACLLVGGTEPYRPKPWFWSDQYDVKLQIAGFNLGFDETLVRPGSREGSRSVWYFSHGELIAVDAINDAKAYVTGKRLLDTGKITPDLAILADPQADLKQLLQ
ncbi:NAD(P)/FAD-dependent oxidoreductase [Agrobacterium sp. ES01]|uniref:NAD(P)/FAD-dependent oxidoreductase n=1 Tax=Agrobacterium sp. ES01 TaxID=3420714 RepID=UPI003D0BD5D5